jgi:hypothetical protein
MSLSEKINEELKAAMKRKDDDALRALRAIKSAILLAKTEKGGGEELDPDTEIKLLQKLAKQRRESIDIYLKQGRDDLVNDEEAELRVIDGYLPKQLSDEDLRERIRNIAQEAGASSPSDLPKVMPVAMKSLSGQAEGKRISEMVKEILSK